MLNIPGFYRIFVLLVSYSSLYSVVSSASLKDLPTECFDATEIDDDTRAFDNTEVPTSSARDLKLTSGWYRFVGKGGNGLKQGYDRFLIEGKDTPYNFCGTQYAGTLTGEHPTEEEGVVEMTVCFRDRSCFFTGTNCPCAADNTNQIYVRNCRKHYIYWLTPTAHNQRYCTGRNRMTGAAANANGASDAVECRDYSTLSSENRVWNEVADVSCEKSIGWYRFIEKAGTEMASTCKPFNETITRLGQPCGAEFRGWMIDKHPTIEDGRAMRRICFSYPYRCDCEFYGNIAVRNCGSFYVYRLSKVPICSAKYCTASQGSLASDNDSGKPPVKREKDDICSRYNPIYDPDRLWSFTSPNLKKCDADLYGVFRFGSKYTPWSIKEGCNVSDMAVFRHRCGSEHQGYMIGKHPVENEGYVERVICFQKPSVPCECQFSAMVGVKNCGKFYAYEFKAVPSCGARYCMVANGSEAITIDPVKPPLHALPAPGYTPVVAKKVDNDDDDSSGLVTTTTVLSIIVFLVIILLIIIILLLIFIVWPYRKNLWNRRGSDGNVHINAREEFQVESKPSGSNGKIPKDDTLLQVEETEIPPYPSVPPPSKPSQVDANRTPLDEDSEIEMQKGPGSDDDLNTIPEDLEYNDVNEYDTLMKDERRPNSYNSSHKDSAV